MGHFLKYSQNYPDTQLTSLVNGLPSELKGKVASAFYGPALAKFELFRQGPWKDEGSQLTWSLTMVMECKVYKPTDVVMQENRVQLELVYLHEGCVWYGELGAVSSQSSKRSQGQTKDSLD